ncbi:MAG TPA: Mrp/NBP35 family ATP-binding protein [Gemmatimonadaceae bacterium]|nr:Mrp/NBP35 family ATP-binding protein [Gemmatimonadaceae bacterium]
MSNPVASPAAAHHGRELDADAVRSELACIPYPGTTRDIVSLGTVSRVTVCGGAVRVEIALAAHDPSAAEHLRRTITRALRERGAATVSVLTREPPPDGQSLRERARNPWDDRVRLGSVRQVVAVGAGKGGVGKSTVAVNLALSLAAEGARVGILDADIYGPSIPILLGMEDGARRVRMTPEKHILPLEASGVYVISFGFFLGEQSPAVWRGPMVSKAVRQFARGVAWPQLDLLVVDLPPGTGDVPLSLAQSIELAGAVVVTQPQRLAVVEARKAGEMFATLGAPVLGVVENMTGAFGSGGGAQVARALGAPFLGSIPFDPTVVAGGDTGHPAVLANPESAFARAFAVIAHAVAGRLGWRRQSSATTARIADSNVPEPAP